MLLLQLFWEFFKTGLFAIGGGLATLPFLSAISDKYGWFSQATLTDMIAVSESTPGPIGINMSTYAGYTTGGFWGALVATVAIVLPSVIIILIVSRFLARFDQSPLVQHAFYGLRPAVCGLIAAAGWSVISGSLLHLGTAEGLLALFNWRAILLFGALLFGILKFKKHPVVYLSIAALCGIVFGM